MEASGSRARGARILVVCTANIRRSPATASMLRFGTSTTVPLREVGISVRSAGVRATEGMGIDSVIADQMEQHGVPYLEHHSLHLKPSYIEWADLILTAERSHRSAVVQMVPAALRQTFTIPEFADLSRIIDPRSLGTESPSVRLNNLMNAAATQRGRRTVRNESDDDLADLVRRTEREAKRLVNEIKEHTETIANSILGPWRALRR